MRHPAIESFLILQDRDQARRALDAQLASVPGEIDKVKARIAAEQAAIEAAKSELRDFEAKKKLLETEIGSAEDKLAKYRTQQSLVKKNDEYQALGHEIESMEATISELEGRELEVLYAIDGAKERFAQAERELKENIAGHEARIATLEERKTNLEAELATANSAFDAAREPVGVPALRLYDRIAERHLPVCVPSVGGKCGGCHLRVSGEVEGLARKGEELARCDQCGRILYWDT